jgi:ubiquinone/menaquinone biosynthesis C-methylase UbiE
VGAYANWCVPLFSAIAGASQPKLAGTGFEASPLAETVLQISPIGGVVALDVQSGMLEELGRRLEAKAVSNVELLHAGLGEGKLGKSRFDVAILVTVLGEVPDKLPALREIFRALRPGGVLSVTEVLPDPHYQSLSRVRELSSQAGFREASIYRGWLSYTVNLGKPAAA